MIDTAPGYERKVFDAAEFPRVVKWVATIAKRNHFEALAGSGHSALPLIGAVAFKLGIPFIAVRKAGESNSHDYGPVHMVIPDELRTYAFVDDMVASGVTLKNVVAKIAKEAPLLRLSGLVTYCSQVTHYDAAKLGFDTVPRFHFGCLEALSND